MLIIYSKDEAKNRDCRGGEIGNTKLSPKKQDTQTKRWCFTCFNDTEKGNEVKKLLSEIGYYGFGIETCPDTKKIHFQGWIELTKRRRLTEMKKLFGGNDWHWEKSKGTEQENIDYCSKEGHYHTNVKDYNIIHPWKFDMWQQYLLNQIEGEEDLRHIHYVYDERGNRGKTRLAKYITHKYNGVICGGKSADNFFIVKTWLDNHPRDKLQVVICDIPRGTDDKFISWSSIEKIKDMCFSSGKYESASVCKNYSPHVIVFSNRPPPEEMLSKDRWKITEL